MIPSLCGDGLSSELLDWYHQQNYDFPWRKTRDPYSVWISEVMLQQTRVSTVLPYYKRWLFSLPNIYSVANNNIDNILKLWEGLGYYNRARNFYLACKIIIEKHGGKIPADPNEFSKLPGVGPYICAAVMSIVFNMPTPTVDGNAVRVISRLNSINIPYPRSKKKIHALLAGLIDPINPGCFNQAVMDLGREICTPKSPRCSVCPVYKHCSAHMNNIVYKYPLRMKNISRPHYHIAVAIIWNNNRILISKRKSTGLLGGLWEFPGGKIQPGEDGPGCVVRKAQEILNVLVDPGACIKKIKHSYSHFSITVEAYRCRFIGGNPGALGCADFRWIFPYETPQFAFHRANHKLFDKIEWAGAV